MAQAEVEMLVRKVGEIALAWRGARDAAEAAALVATYRGLLRELGARGLDADVLDLMDTLPDVLMPPGWRIEEPPAPPPVPCNGDDWRSVQLRDAFAEAVRQREAAASTAAQFPSRRRSRGEP